MIARFCSLGTTGLSGGDRSAPKQNFADDARASTPLRAIEPFEVEDADELDDSPSQCGTLASHAFAQCSTCVVMMVMLQIRLASLRRDHLRVAGRYGPLWQRELADQRQ